MPIAIRKVNYVYVTVGSKPGEAARILGAVRDANVDLLAFTGFPVGRNRAQVDLVAADVAPLRAVAKRLGLKLSRAKRAFLAQGVDEVGVAIPPLETLGANNINVIAADAIASGDGRFGMLVWVTPRDYNRAAKLLDAR
jgi:hypothetical protein